MAQFKLGTFTLGIILVLVGLVFFYFFAEKNGETKCELEYQKQIEQANVKVITDTKMVFERKAVFKAASIDANLEWLRVNRCKDCDR